MTLTTLLFCRIDKDRNGSISADELQQALSNGKSGTLHYKFCSVMYPIINIAVCIVSAIRFKTSNN